MSHFSCQECSAEAAFLPTATDMGDTGKASGKPEDVVSVVGYSRLHHEGFYSVISYLMGRDIWML